VQPGAGRRTLPRGAALATLLASPRTARAEPPPDEASRDHRISPEGRRFRVRFDPASRARIGAASAIALDPRGASPARPGLEIDAGVAYRAWLPSGAGSARVVWQVDHRVLAGWVAPTARTLAGAPTLDAALYSASLLRHDGSPRVVLPTSPPVSVPFPFNDQPIAAVVQGSYRLLPPTLSLPLRGSAPRGARRGRSPLLPRRPCRLLPLRLCRW